MIETCGRTMLKNRMTALSSLIFYPVAAVEKYLTIAVEKLVESSNFTFCSVKKIKIAYSSFPELWKQPKPLLKTRYWVSWWLKLM